VARTRAVRHSDFQQRAVLLIETILSTGSIRIAESLSVADYQRAPREIDVAILNDIGRHLAIKPIEVRRRADRDDIGWVDSLIGKYVNIDFARPVIAVSTSGFSDNAAQKAQPYGIRLVHMAEGGTPDWVSMMRDPKVLGADLIDASHIKLLSGPSRKFRGRSSGMTHRLG
jgi:hypothetical protein